MRKLYLFAGMALMAVMMAFVTSSCSKSDDDGGGGNGGDSSAIIGTWYMTFQSAKGNGYVVLTFAQNGNGLCKEYDHSTWQTDIFTYSYANGKLTVKWGPNDIEVVEVVSLTKTQMVLKGFPDKGTNTFYIMTQDMQNLLNSL